MLPSFSDKLLYFAYDSLEETLPIPLFVSCLPFTIYGQPMPTYMLCILLYSKNIC